METRELIAKLEATLDEADDLTRRLIEDLKEHAAASEAVDRLTTLRLEQRQTGIALAIEAHIALTDIQRRAWAKRMVKSLFVGAAQ